MKLSDKQWDALLAVLEGDTASVDSGILGSLVAAGMAVGAGRKWRLTGKGHDALATIIHA